MFGKKPEDQQESMPATRSDAPAAASPAAAPAAARPATAPPPSRPASGRGEGAFIGASIQIHGELRGEEDVFVEGQVHGAVHLVSNTLTIGSRGRLKANVYANTILVDGHVEGDLYGSEQVIVRKSAEVRGNISSPRVSLEDGATFKGSIEMDPEAVKAAIGSSGQGQRGGAALKPAPAPAAAGIAGGQRQA
jgi:cytoskeletal protein CcmA (bactofilin family)